MKMIVTDIDGVLTDGRVNLDVNGNETKTICYRDLDAIGIGRRAGYDFAFVTGEDTEMVSVFAGRFDVHFVYAGAKDKLAAVQNISNEFSIPLDRLIYIGDSDRDAPAIEVVGLGITPNDATAKAKCSASAITDSNGGAGVLFEVVKKLIAGDLMFPEKGTK